MNLNEEILNRINKLVHYVYFEIEQNLDPDRIRSLISKNNLGKYQINRKIYPIIKFTISPEEIDDAIRLKYFDENYLPASSLGSDYPKMTSIEKLFYSILWKNGDLGKVKRIIEGITSHANYPNNSIVFHQFGRYLENKREPLIDQHVIRTFMIYMSTSEEDLLKAISLKQISKNQAPIVESYISWIKSLCEKSRENEEDLIISIDEVLFALGKSIKGTINKGD